MGEKWDEEKGKTHEVDLAFGVEGGQDQETHQAFLKRVERFECFSQDPEQYHKIFTGLGFAFVDDSCDGYCPDCRRKQTCEIES